MNTSRNLSVSQQLALDTILRKPCMGIGIFWMNLMEWRMIDRLAAVPEGTYEKNPEETYLQMEIRSGVCMLDQWIPKNPLGMKQEGFDDSAVRGATTGAKEIIRDGIRIDSPEAVIEHMERFVFPGLKRDIATFDPEAKVKAILDYETKTQDFLGNAILKTSDQGPAMTFPSYEYGVYGYENYFMAYALYPEVMERYFKLGADFALLHNQAGARAFIEGGLSPYIRTECDMTDSRGTLTSIESLDRIWFPHFARCIRPFIDANINILWHSDGNIMQMAPRLLESGLKGFQGFQYEDGVEYEKICKMKAKDGDSLLIVGGVSVTRTLPFGTPADVRNEMRWLVEQGPKTGLFLGVSSSIAPGVPWENLKTLVEGFQYYREKGRN